MTVRTKVIGRQPTDHGPYDPNLAYGKKFQCTLFGCSWESKHDNNTTAPAVWDGGDTITPNLVDWKKVSGSYESWLLSIDKPATTGTTGDYPFNGLGKVVLKKNIQDVSGTDKNLLTQDMFYKGAVGSSVPNINTIFVIQYDYELAEDITIPDGCVLQFEGGSINGAYTITGVNTGIQAGLVKILGTDVTLAGTWNIAEVYPEWFGAKGDGVTDDSQYIEKANNFSTDDRSIFVVLSKVYYIAQTINVYKSLSIKGFHVIDRPFNALSNIDPSSESCIIIADGVTAFDVKGIPENDATRFATINIYGIKVVGESNSLSENFIVINAFGYPGRMNNIKDCEFAGLNKVIDFNVTDYGYSAGILNIENVFCYLSNHFIYALDNHGNRPSVCNLHIKDCDIEYMRDTSLKIYSLFGSNIIENCLFEDNSSNIDAIDIKLVEGATLEIKSNYFTQISGYSIKIVGQDRPKDFGKTYISIFDNVIAGSASKARFEKVHIVNGQDLDKFIDCKFSICAIDSLYTEIPLSWIEDYVLVTGKYVKPATKPNIITDVSFNKKINGFLGRDCDKNTEAVSLALTYNIDKPNYAAFYKDKEFITFWFTNNHGIGSVYSGFSALPGIIIVKSTIDSNDGYMNVRVAPYNLGDGTVFGSQPSIFLDANGNISEISAAKIGDSQFDESNNKPIWWNGTAWVDATGATV